MSTRWTFNGLRHTGLALRGGSWNNNQNNARVSGRNNNHPDNNWNNNGFRVCCAPHGFAFCRKYWLMFGQRSRQYWRAASLPAMGKNKKVSHVPVTIPGDRPCETLFLLLPWLCHFLPSTLLTPS